MTHKILLCTIGATPQIVTETIWFLMEKRKPAWIPDEIVIITTTFALDLVRKELQAPDGRLAQLLGRTPPTTIHVPRRGRAFDVYRAHGEPAVTQRLKGSTETGEALVDVTTEADALLMSAIILRLVVDAVKQPGSQLHLSLAGGRKTMSAHALMAMTMVGRFTDEASHVLVSTPFENQRHFWYPTQEGLVDLEFDRNGVHRGYLDPKQAEIWLVPTRGPLMRDRVKDATIFEGLDLIQAAELINLAQQQSEHAQVTLDTLSNSIQIGAVKRKFGHKQFAVIRLLATAALERWPGALPEREPGYGWLTTEHVVTAVAPDGERIDEKVLRFIKDAQLVDGVPLHLPKVVVGPSGRAPVKDDKSAFDAWLEVMNANTTATKTAYAKSSLGGNFTKLNDALASRFGPAAARLFRPITGKNGAYRLGLHYSSQSISIN